MNINDISHLEVDGVDSRDYPDFSDAYFSSGIYKGKDLNDVQLERLSDDYPDILNEMAHESLI